MTTPVLRITTLSLPLLCAVAIIFFVSSGCHGRRPPAQRPPVEKKDPFRIDSDGDGVADANDRCPRTQRGVLTSAFGCPDRDQDGVEDERDRCPDSKPASLVGDDGCPPDFKPNGRFSPSDEFPKESLDQILEVLGSVRGLIKTCPDDIRAPSMPVPIDPPFIKAYNHFPRTLNLTWHSSVDQCPPITYAVEVDCVGCCAVASWCSEVGETWLLVAGIADAGTPTMTLTHTFVGDQWGRWRVIAFDGNLQMSTVHGWHYFHFDTSPSPQTPPPPPIR